MCGFEPEEYYATRHGKRVLHRVDGPAVLKRDGTEEYWIDGELCNETQFKQRSLVVKWIDESLDMYEEARRDNLMCHLNWAYYSNYPEMPEEERNKPPHLPEHPNHVYCINYSFMRDFAIEKDYLCRKRFIEVMEGDDEDEKEAMMINVEVGQMFSNEEEAYLDNLAKQVFDDLKWPTHYDNWPINRPKYGKPGNPSNGFQPEDSYYPFIEKDYVRNRVRELIAEWKASHTPNQSE